MKHIFLIAALTAWPVMLSAQGEVNTFKGHFRNDDYRLYIHIDLHGDGLEVPGHELFGPLPGYLGKDRYSYYWLVNTAEVKSDRLAHIQLVNDYGSEDLMATLRMVNDTTCVLEQGKGSTLKMPDNGKWQKLPNKIEFKRVK